MKTITNKLAVRLEDLLPTLSSRVTRTGKPGGKKQIVVPPLGSHVTIWLVAGTGGPAKALIENLLPRFAKGGPRSARHLRQRFALNAKEIRRLCKQSDKVIAWIRANRTHAALFAADSVSALAKALPKLDWKLLQKLSRFQTRQDHPQIPNLRISSLRLVAYPAKGEKK